jgi:hypothetical protein
MYVSDLCCLFLCEPLATCVYRTCAARFRSSNSSRIADTYVRGVDHRRVLRPVNTNRNFAGRGAQLLVQSTISPYPHVLFRYLHL